MLRTFDVTILKRVKVNDQGDQDNIDFNKIIDDVILNNSGKYISYGIREVKEYNVY